MKVNVFFALVLLISVFACKTDTAPVDNSVAGLEKALESNSSDSLTQKLITAYRQHVATNPTDSELNSKYLYRAAGLFFRKSQYANAAQMLMQGIQNYPEASNTAASLHLLADLYNDHLRMNEMANDLYQGLVDKYPNYADLAKVKAKMTAPTTPLASRLDTLINSMYDDKTHSLDRRKAAQYISGCEVFAMVNPNDPKSPELLLKAAEMARTIRNYPKALTIYDWVYSKFQDYPKVGQALFLKAFTLDNDMKKYELARPVYEAFLANHPEDVFAKDTKFLLDNLGKSDNEIINNFNK